MPSLPALTVFVPTFVLVSLTPGMCMMLSLSLGMRLGVRRTLPMMTGELAGVGLVAVAAVVGAAALMLRYPAAFMLLKWGGGAYLVYLGVMMWRDRGGPAEPADADPQTSGTGALALATQGFVTAVANPKGWAFFIALLPPFLEASRPLAPQLALLVGLILGIEFCSLLLYASGGQLVRDFLHQRRNVVLLNRVAGTLMAAVGVWLALA